MSPPNSYQQRSKNTPRKGRPRRDSTQSPRNVKPAKNYASENDIPRDSTGVRTPRRGTPGGASSNFPGLRGSTGPNPHRNRQKGRPTSIATVGSPAHLKVDRNSPPASGGASVPDAYAGAAFHASPAASALPIPSFMKGRAGSPSTCLATQPSNLSQEPSPPTSDSESSSSPTESCMPQHRAPVQESPLDFFFQRDREERQRTGRAHSAQGILAPPSPSSPPQQSPNGANGVSINDRYRSGNRDSGVGASWGDRNSPTEPVGGVPVNGASSARVLGSGNREGNRAFSSEELDGTPGRPIGPTFSTPFHDRIRAARGRNSSGPPTPGKTQRSPDEGAHILKSLLNIADQPAIFGASKREASLSSSSLNGSAETNDSGYRTGYPSMNGVNRRTSMQAATIRDSVEMTNSLKNLLRIS